ncbi:MAG: cation transporter [Deltaproteobacteria bacterium]|nr:cation transporter [Deltaproteobacteria bacterium]
MDSARNIDSELKNRFKFAAGLTGVVFLAELAGGYATNSLALISDAMHVFMDLLALCLSFFAIYVSALAPTGKRTYGLHRVEVFASFINGVTLVIVSLFIFYAAYSRFLNPPEVGSLGMLAIAAVGLVANIVVALWLRAFARADLNVKSAFFHVIWDAVASAGVILAAVIIYFSKLYVFDPLLSAGIAVMVLYGSSRIVLDSSHILLEGVPKDIDLTRVVNDMTGIEGVEGVHSLHIWSICHNINALSAHLDIDVRSTGRSAEILKKVNEGLAERHHIF